MRLLKRFLAGGLVLLLLFVVLMLMPRAYSVFFPEKPPVGYHYLWTSYLAIMTGLERIVETNPPVPDDLDMTRNIEYKNIEGNSLQLDFLKPRNVNTTLPLAVMIHGGSWRHGNRADMMPIMIDLARRGYATATVSYRLKETYPSCVEDIADAVNWLFEHGDEYGYDPDRVALVGASAGAHLAMMAGYGWKEKTGRADSIVNPHRIKAVINIFGAVDLTTEFGQNQRLVPLFMGMPYAESPETWKEASPISYVDSNSPPTLTLHGTSDELVPVDQADQLKHSLDSLGVPCVDYRFPLWPHAMILVQRVYDYCIPRMDEFLRQYLDGPGSVASESRGSSE